MPLPSRLRRLELALIASVSVASVASFAACVGDEPAGVVATPGDAAAEAAPGPNDGATDAQGDTGPEGPACDRTKAFSSLDELTELNSAASVGNFTPRLTADGLQLFFTRALAGDDFRLFRTKRASRKVPFEPPTEVLGLNRPAGEYDSHPFPLPDGTALYFQRTTGGAQGRDIFRAVATGSSFTQPAAVMGLSTTAINERAPYLANDGRMWVDFELADGGTRRRIGSAHQVRPDAFDAVEPVDLGTPALADDQEAVLSQDGRTLYFASTRETSTGGWDIWVAQRATPGGAWDPPQPLTFLNTGANEEPSWISPDDCELYFMRIVGITYHIFRARRP